LALITEARISLERELNLSAECRPAKRRTIAAKVDDCPAYPPATVDSSVPPCSSLAAEEDDYVLSGYSYLIGDDGNDSVDDIDDDHDDDDDESDIRQL